MPDTPDFHKTSPRLCMYGMNKRQADEIQTMDSHTTSSRSVSVISTESSSSATSSSTEDTVASAATSITDEESGHRLNHPLSSTFVLLRKMQQSGHNGISILAQLKDKNAIWEYQTSVYSLDGESSCCATVSVEGPEMGAVYSTMFGYQSKATKQRAADLLVAKLEWFLAPAFLEISTTCFEASPTTTCLQKGLPPPASEYVLSPKQIKLLQTAESHLQLLKDSVNDSGIAYIAVDIEAHDDPRSSQHGCVKEIGVSWLPAGGSRNVEPSTRHMIVEGRETLRNVYCRDATHEFGFGRSEVLPLASITQEIENIFEEVAQNDMLVYLIGWSFANDERWLKDSHQFNVDLDSKRIRVVDVSMVWQAMHQSLERRKLGDVLRDQGVEYATMHNAGNDARATMDLFWKIRQVVCGE